MTQPLHRDPHDDLSDLRWLAVLGGAGNMPVFGKENREAPGRDRHEASGDDKRDRSNTVRHGICAWEFYDIGRRFAPGMTEEVTPSSWHGAGQNRIDISDKDISGFK